MAELHELRPAAGSHRSAKRKGRGPGSGKGKTAGRGENGQKSRSGGSIRPGFEGGQMPLQRRIPKRGFTPRKRHVYQIVNVADLARVEGTTVNAETLKDAGLIRSSQGLIKVLAMGELSQAYSVEAHKFSGGAVAKIEAAGGTVTTLGPIVREPPAVEEPVVGDSAEGVTQADSPEEATEADSPEEATEADSPEDTTEQETDG
jgi:large subunit ribosomal protein L15